MKIRTRLIALALCFAFVAPLGCTAAQLTGARESVKSALTKGASIGSHVAEGADLVAAEGGTVVDIVFDAVEATSNQLRGVKDFFLDLF